MGELSKLGKSMVKGQLSRLDLRYRKAADVRIPVNRIFVV